MSRRDEPGVKERSFGSGGCLSSGFRSRSRSRIWHVKELGVSCCPGFLGLSLDRVLGKREVFGEPGLFEHGVPRALTPWQGMMRSKSHPFTILASLAMVLRNAVIRGRSTNGKKCKNTYALFLLSLQMKFLWNSVWGLSFLVRKPVLRCLDWEYCSLAGKLKIRSATMRVFVGL